jgi:hypothetical protein
MPNAAINGARFGDDVAAFCFCKIDDKP